MTASSPSSAWGVVPEFYFDLISRVPPGVLLFVALLLEFEWLNFSDIPTFFSASAGQMVLIVGFLLFVGMTLGVFLSVFGVTFAARSFYSVVWQKKLQDAKHHIEKYLMIYYGNTSRLDSIDGTSDDDRMNRDKLYRELLDFVQHYDDRAAVLLPKYSAETCLCYNTAAALSIFIFIHVLHRIFCSIAPFPEIGYYITLVLALLFVLYAGRVRYKREMSILISFVVNVVNRLK